MITWHLPDGIAQKIKGINTCKALTVAGTCYVLAKHLLPLLPLLHVAAASCSLQHDWSHCNGTLPSVSGWSSVRRHLTWLTKVLHTCGRGGQGYHLSMTHCTKAFPCQQGLKWKVLKNDYVEKICSNSVARKPFSVKGQITSAFDIETILSITTTSSWDYSLRASLDTPYMNRYDYAPMKS